MFILGAVNVSHAPGADLFGDAVVSQPLANKRILDDRVVRYGGRPLPPFVEQASDDKERRVAVDRATRVIYFTPSFTDSETPVSTSGIR